MGRRQAGGVLDGINKIYRIGRQGNMTESTEFLG
jgi:hypothetical protein